MKQAGIVEYLHFRRHFLLNGIQLDSQVGAEVGALNNPLVKRSEGDILYIDYARTDALREQHKNSLSINPIDIVDVDIVWAEKPLVESVGEKGPLDYVLAAHVIEHVPNLIGWLFDIASVLKPQGVLSLAIPDRRHTFDFFRPESSVGEMVEAYLLDYKVPSIRQVFDHCFLGVELSTDQSWRRNTSILHFPKFMGDLALPLAYSQAVEINRESRYIDSHCWVFTPEGWLRNMHVLDSLSLLSFTIEAFQPTKFGQNEFLMRLRKTDTGDPEITSSLNSALCAIHDDENERHYRSLHSKRCLDRTFFGST